MLKVQSNNLEIFLDNCKNLGLKINREVSSPRTYIDIEKHLLDSTRFINDSIRVARYIEYWAYSFGSFLSVKKINQLIKNKYPYNEQILKGLIGIIQKRCKSNTDFRSLKFKKKKFSLVNIVEGFSFKNKDENWLKVNVIAPIFIPDEIDKHIREDLWLKNNCPEIYLRKIGVNSTYADIVSYKKFNPDHSLYKVAKELNISYSTVFNNISKFSNPL